MLDIEFVTEQQDTHGRNYKIIFGKIETIKVCSGSEKYFEVNGVRLVGNYLDLIKILNGKFDSAFQAEHYNEQDGLWRL